MRPSRNLNGLARCLFPRHLRVHPAVGREEEGVVGAFSLFRGASKRESSLFYWLGITYAWPSTVAGEPELSRL